MTSSPAVTAPDGCTLKNVTSCVFTGLDPAIGYTFSVRATGPFGQGLAATSATPVATAAPSTPGTPNVQVTFPSTVLVSWAASPSGGGPRTGYTVTSDPVVTSPCVNISATTCSFAGLDPATEYTFLVTANGPGASTPSVARSKRIIPGPPAQPGKPTVQVAGPGLVTVTWSPAPATAGPVTGYTVATADSVLTSSCTGPALSCDFPVPGPGPYTFVVTAVGPGGFTPSVPSSPISLVAPGAPGVPVATVTGPGAVHLTWAASGGGPLTGYTVSSPSATAPAACINTSALACDFTNLTTGAYTFRVTANGPAGSATSAAYSDAVTVAAPGAPGTPTATVTSSRSVRLTWPASSGGGPLTGYTVSSNPAVTPPNGCLGTSAVFCDFTGLSPAQPYYFTVTANGPAGNALSDTVGPVSTALPGAPTTPTATVLSPGTVRVTWAGAQSGGTQTSYTVTSDPVAASSCVNVAGPTCDFTNLAQSTPYTFLVTANGPAGGTPSVARSVAVVPGAPGAPGRPTAQVTGPNEVSVSWAPSVGGGPLTRYSVTSDSVAPQACTDIVALNCAFPVTGAGPFTFVVTAFGPGGNAGSEPGLPVSVVRPGAPGTPTAVVRSAGTVRVSWTASTGGLLTGYTVSSDPAVTAPAGCVGTSALVCDFTGLGTGSYSFLVTANSVAGGSPSAAASNPVTVAAPGEPGTPTASVTSPTSVRVTWTGSSGGGPLTGYTVTSDPAITPPNGCIGTTELFCDFPGLRTGQPYTFLVTARGAAGSTASTARSTAVTPIAAISTTLDAPAKPTVAPTDANTAVRVSWVAPGAGAGIAGYLVQSTSGGFGCETAGTTCVVPGLTSTTSYAFQVRAVGTADGVISGWSPASDAIVPGALATPTSVEAVGANHQIAVSWTRPTTAGIVSYLATASPGGQSCTAVAAESECVISGLTNGIYNTVSVVAVAANTALNSAPSAASNRVRPTAGAPGSPTAVRVVAGDGSAAISWTAPTWVGDGILSYTATAAGSPDGLYCVTATTSCTIVGLANASDYQITVVAIGRNASGNSAPSTPVLAQPRIGTPVPTSVTVTPGALTLTVQFVPGNTVTNVANYTATATAGAFSFSCTTPNASSTSCVITGVTAGTVYSVTVAANLISGGRSAASAPPKVVTATTYGPPVLPTPLPTVIYGPLTSSVSGPLPLGSSTTITGANFTPFTVITVGAYPASGAPVVLATGVADGNGLLTVSVPITGLAAGPYTIVAGGLRSATAVRYRSLAVSVTAPVG